VAHRLHRLVQRTGNLLRATTVVLQEVKCHALRRLHSHAGELAKCVDQGVEMAGH
jgi:hypothetical protein